MSLSEPLKQFSKYFIEKGKILLARRKKITNTIRAHHGFYAFFGGIGVVMFWYGIWEGLNMLYSNSSGFLKFLAHPVTSLVVGSLILAITGLFVFELIGREATALKMEVEDINEELTEQAIKDAELEGKIEDIEEQTLNN